VSLLLNQVIIFDEDADLYSLITHQYATKCKVVWKLLDEIVEVKDYLNTFIIIRDPSNKTTAFFEANNFLTTAFKENHIFIVRSSRDNCNLLYEPIKLEKLFALITKFLHEANLSKIQKLHDSIYFDYINQKVYLNEQVILLSEKESLILQYLFEKQEEVTKEQLLRDIWHYKDGVNTHTVETHIYRIRNKIKSDIIITTKDGNYKLLH